MWPTVILSAFVVGLMACGEGAGDLRPWKASDHDQGEPSKGQGRRQVSGEVAPGSDPNATLADVTWRQNCSLCHGPQGRGDGPQAAMFKVRDLTDPEFLKTLTDAGLRKSIRQGKNKMPAFDLPLPVIDALIGRIRRNARRPR